MTCLKLLFYFILLSIFCGFSYCNEDSFFMNDQNGDGSVIDKIVMPNFDFNYQFHSKSLDGDSSFNSDLSQRSKELNDRQAKSMSSKQTPLASSAVGNLNLDSLVDGSNILLVNGVNKLEDDLLGAKKSLNGMPKNFNYDAGLNVGNRANIRLSLDPESRSARRRKSKPEEDAKSTNTTEETPKKILNFRQLIQSLDKKKGNETIPVTNLKPTKQTSKKIISPDGKSSTAMPDGTSTYVTKSASSKSPSSVTKSVMQSDSPSTHVAALKGNLAERTLTYTTNSINSPVEHSDSIKNVASSKSVTAASPSVRESQQTKTSHAETTTPSTTTTVKMEISTRPTQTATMKPTSPVLVTTERPHITSPHTTHSSTVRNAPRSTTHRVTTVTSTHVTSTPASITTTTTIKPSSKNTTTPKPKARKSSALTVKPYLLAILILPILNLMCSI